MDILGSVLLDAGAKALLYGGVILLVGAGMFRHAISPELADDLRRPLWIVASVGAGAILVLSAVHLVLVLYRTLGFLEADILLDYVTSSNHGRATCVRGALTLVLAGIAFVPRRTWLPIVWGAGAVGLLATFSVISHNASMPGRLPVPADLVHLIAGVAWTGAVLAVAFLPVWSVDRRAELERAMARVSLVGLTAVAVLFATGVYSAQLHVGEPTDLVTTRYGWALVVKVALVLAILALAARNRWHFLPSLRRDGPTEAFAKALRIEAVLLLAVIGVTGWLTTSPMPH